MKIITAFFWILFVAGAQAIDIPALHEAAPLDGEWKQQQGDDLRWAEPAFDDSAWPAIRMPRAAAPGPLGFTWFRIHVRIVQLPPQPLYLMIGPLFPAYEVFANGRSVGSFGGPLGGRAGQILAEPARFALPPPNNADEIVIAIRTYDANLIDGPQRASVEASRSWIGTRQTVDGVWARWQLDRTRRSLPVLALVVALGLSALFFLSIPLMRRGSWEYLWLSLWIALVTSRRLVLMIPETIGWTSRLWRGYFNGLTDNLSELITIFFWASLFRQRPSWVAWSLLVLETVAEWAGSARYKPVVMLSMAGIYLDFSWRRYRRRNASDESMWPLHVGFLLYWAPTVVYNLIHLGGEPDTPTVADIAVRSSTLAFVFAMAMILNQRSARTESAQQRLQQEIKAAAEIQSLLLPAASLSNAAVAIQTVSLPASDVGGDFYQALPFPDGSSVAIIGDVSGKGLRAAMIVSVAIGAIRRTGSSSPSAILRDLNEALVGRAAGGFTTCCCVRCEPGGRVTIANAGHPAPYLEGREMPVDCGLPLGISEEAEYQETVFQVESFEQIVLVSDGVIEAANSNGELLGFDRTRDISTKSAQEIADAARAWGQNDDITVVTVRRQR